ncbi:GlsB/YeaQ/YmgE family stress response membrane protein, partial [bacterium]|nr:GlsB/YeaQ/YmgE family stress response membrane protein [bacterium]
MDIVWFLLIGVAAGWLASQIMKGGGSGLVTDLIMGVIGAILGG